MRRAELSVVLLFVCVLSGCNAGAGNNQAQLGATHFSVSAEASATVGAPISVMVTAVDAAGGTATTYSGMVHFTSSDPQAVLPTNSALAGGAGTFSVTLKTAGNQTITVTDTATASIAGTSNAVNVASGVTATHFSVSAPASASVGSAFNFMVTALEAAGGTATTYSGTVHFTSTDAQALLPANSTLANGTGTFSATFKTAGNQTLAAADTVTPSISGMSSSINVSRDQGPQLNITSGTPPPGTVGTPYDPVDSCTQGSPGCTCVTTFVITICHRDRNLIGFALAATGGVQPYSWNWAPSTGSELPSGLTIRAVQTGGSTRCCVSFTVIGGTPTAAGTYNVVVTVTDSESPAASASANYSITISPPTAPSAKQAAQDGQDQAPKHHHYKLINLGTLGGPGSRMNGFDYSTFASIQDLNNAGTVTGWADTSTPDPFQFSGNVYETNFCFDGSCYLDHAFEWRKGVLTDLGALPGGFSSASSWVSANGLIAGVSQNGELDPLNAGFPEDRAVLWRDGKIIDLGTLPEGGYESGAEAVNSRGQVVGWALNTVADPNSLAVWSSLYNYYAPIDPLQMRAFIWQDGVMRDLGTLGTGTDAFAMAINERGQVIGISYTSATPNQVVTSCSYPGTGQLLPTQDPFLWENGRMIDLGTLGGTCGFPSWINNRGDVVGASDLTGDQTEHAFLWTKEEGMQDLGTFGGSNSFASMINDSGLVVGGASLEGDAQYDAFLWDGKLLDLGTLNGANCAYAFSVNSREQVVGNSGPDCATSAFLWEGGGPMVDLSAIASPNPGFAQLNVITINERGEIAGIGIDASGVTFAVALIPCDEEHPGIDGCNYSLVDAATSAAEAAANPAQHSLESNSQSPASIRGSSVRRRGPYEF